jgi:hypothetical protein
VAAVVEVHEGEPVREGDPVREGEEIVLLALLLVLFQVLLRPVHLQAVEEKEVKVARPGKAVSVHRHFPRHLQSTRHHLAVLVAKEAKLADQARVVAVATLQVVVMTRAGQASRAGQAR